MPEYQDWIIRRLEGELDNARKETDALRSKLEAREERIRVLELKVNRFEVEQELSTEDIPASLADKFDPDAIGRMADKLAPFAVFLGDIMKTIKPTGTPQSMMVPPIPNIYQSPFGSTGALSDVNHLLFPDENAKQ